MCSFPFTTMIKTEKVFLQLMTHLGLLSKLSALVAPGSGESLSFFAKLRTKARAAAAALSGLEMVLCSGQQVVQAAGEVRRV